MTDLPSDLRPPPTPEEAAHMVQTYRELRALAAEIKVALATPKPPAQGDGDPWRRAEHLAMILAPEPRPGQQITIRQIKSRSNQPVSGTIHFDRNTFQFTPGEVT